MFSKMIIKGSSIEDQTDGAFDMPSPSGGIQYNPERLILILYSSVQLCAIMQIYSTKYMKRNESAIKCRS